MWRLLFRIFLYVFGVVIILALSLKLYTLLLVERQTPTDAAPPETTFLSHDSDTIAFQTWSGTGDTTVVMVGGLSAWTNTWERTVEEQRKRGSQHTFVAIDLPPFGYSSANASDSYSRVDQATRIGAVLDHLELESAVLLGHSYGGGPMAEYALRSPEQVERLILISPVLNLDAAAPATLSTLVASDFLRHTAVATILPIKRLLLSQLESFVHVTENISYQLLNLYTTPFVVDGTARKLSNWLAVYLTDDLRELPSTDATSYKTAPFPIVLLWGEEDTLTPIEEAGPLASGGATLITLPGIGHIPMIEDIDYFNEQLFEALKSPE